MKNITSHILAWLALAVFCEVVSCKKPDPTVSVDMPNGDTIYGKYNDIVPIINRKFKIVQIDKLHYLAIDTTADNDWIKDHSEIKNLEK